MATFKPLVIRIQCEHMRQNTYVHVKAVIYNANTQTPTHETHIHHFSTLFTSSPQRQCGVNTEICHLSLSSIRFSVGFRLGWHGWDSDCCYTDEGLRPLSKAPLGGTRRFKPTKNVFPLCQCLPKLPVFHVLLESHTVRCTHFHKNIGIVSFLL